jgi:hypothetical protein
VPAFWQLDWLLLPEMEQVPALVHELCDDLLEIEQVPKLLMQVLRGELGLDRVPDTLHEPLAPSHDLSLPTVQVAPCDWQVACVV